jgi:hypothetical protein
MLSRRIITPVLDWGIWIEEQLQKECEYSLLMPTSAGRFHDFPVPAFSGKSAALNPMARLWRDGVILRGKTQRTLTAADSVNIALSRFVSNVVVLQL